MPRYRRTGRSLKMIPGSHLAAMAVGAGVRAAARGVAQYAARMSVKKAALAGATAAAAGTAATMSSLGKRKTPPNRAGGYTSKQRRKYVRTSGVNSTGVKGPVTGNELQVVKTRFGSKKLMTPAKIKKITARQVTWRLQNIAPIDRGTNSALGAMILPSCYRASSVINVTNNNLGYVNNDFAALAAPSAPNSVYQAPIHVYSLNSTRNGTDQPAAAYQLFIDDITGGGVQFQPLYFTETVANNSVTNTLVYRPESMNHPTFSDPSKYIQPEWYDIRLCLRNATAQRTWYDIMIVSFKDKELDPLDNTPAGDNFTRRVNFWQTLARRSVTHPISSWGNDTKGVKNGMQVHKRMRVVMDRNYTDMTDNSPTFKVVKMFYRDGGIYNHEWFANNLPAGLDTVAMVNANQYEQEGTAAAEYSGIPNVRARKWLIIQAYDPSFTALTGIIGGNDTLIDVTNTPSYDVLIRRKESRY